MLLDERVLRLMLVGCVHVHLGWVHEERVSSIKRGKVVKVAIEFFCYLLANISLRTFAKTYQLPCVSFGEGSPCST